MLRRHDGLGLIASHKNLVVSMHWGRTTLGHADELTQCVAELMTEHKRYASVVIVTGHEVVHAPDAQTRERLRQLVEDTADSGLGTAFIVTMGGFLGGAVVALLSGLFVLSRSPEPNKAFGTIEPAAAWLQGMLAEGPTRWMAGEVEDTLEAIVALGSATSTIAS